MKYGIAIKIDVKKIDKERLFKGKEAIYLDATMFVDTDQESQFGDHGMITQDVSKDERAQGVKGNILGNCKVFWSAESQNQNAPSNQNYQGGSQNQTQQPESDSEIPF